MFSVQHLLSFLAVVGTIQASQNDLEKIKLCLTGFRVEWDILIVRWNTQPPAPPPAPGCQRRVCYFTNWSEDQDGAGFPPEDFDASLCTHIIFSRARIVERNSDRCRRSSDPSCYEKYWDLEFDPKAKDKMYALKRYYRKNMKVLVSVQASSRIIKAMSKRYSLFSSFAAKRIAENGFDGLDLYFPASGQSLDLDKTNIIRLVKELRVELKNVSKFCMWDEPLLMTATLPGDKATVRSGFDIPSLSRDLDFINLMTFDSPEDSNVKWRHFSPLFGNTENTREHNIDFYVRNWIEKGFPKDKIVIGIPAYGSSFSLTHVTHDYVTYNEVCKMIQDADWVKRFPKEKVPTILHGSKLVFYDDPQSVTTKLKYIKAKGYGGVMVRSLDGFNTTACKTGKYPLLNALKQECTP